MIYYAGNYSFANSYELYIPHSVNVATGQQPTKKKGNRKIPDPESWNCELCEVDIASRLRSRTNPTLVSTKQTRMLSVLCTVDPRQDIPCHTRLRVLRTPYGFDVRHLRLVHPRFPPDYFEHNTVFGRLFCQNPVELSLGGDRCWVILYLWRRKHAWRGDRSLGLIDDHYSHLSVACCHHLSR
jgi:hypothetical protein